MRNLYEWMEAIVISISQNNDVSWMLTFLEVAYSDLGVTFGDNNTLRSRCFETTFVTTQANKADASDIAGWQRIEIIYSEYSFASLKE